MAGTTKTPKFKDTVQKRVRLKNAEKAVFFAPHTSEYFAVAPLISKLSEKLEKYGKETEKEITIDMRVWVSMTSNRLSENKTSREELDLVERLFKLEDAWLRLQKLSGLIEKNPKAVVLEVHALDKDYQENSEFRMADYFYRLPHTRVLVIRDLVNEYDSPITEGLYEMDRSNKRHMDILKCFELEPRDIGAKYEDMLDILSRNIERVAMIEMPAPSESHLRRTGIGFWDRLIFSSFGLPSHLTKFEESYIISSSREATITEADIQGILKMLSED